MSAARLDLQAKTKYVAGLLLALLLLLNGLLLTVCHLGLALDAPELVQSTPGQLSLWVAGQTERPDASALLVQLTRPTVPNGILSETTALVRARATLALFGLLATALAAGLLYLVWRQAASSRQMVVWLLLAYAALLLNVPALTVRPFYPLVLTGMVLLLLLLFVVPGSYGRIYGFFIIICALMVSWELYKLLGNATGNVMPLTDFPWKLPHLQDIAEQMLKPARRNGPFLLVRILAEAAVVTWRSAAIGFTFGSLLGLLLGTLFAHSRLLERGLLPYVVASQTVPIIAIAPMIVAFLGQGWLPVAIIAMYLTFFPVTVNTLRGLLSPAPLKLELMRSYAASPLLILWKLRLPSALPFIFTALKISATASVVGAIVGELPSSRSDGLAAAILRASGNYAAEPEKLWAAIVMASLIGMLFFLMVSLAERLVLRHAR
jgi:NitT/TauT family transport system permease protein